MLIVITHYRFSSIMSYFSAQLMNDVSSSLYSEIAHEMSSGEIQTKFSANQTAAGILDPSDLSKLLDYTYAQVKTVSAATPSLYQVAWGGEDGTSLEVEKFEDGSIVFDFLDRSHIPVTRTITKRDPNGNIIKKEVSKDISYDPRTRPWYIRTKDAKTTTWSEVYPSSRTGLFGISASTPVYKKNGELNGLFKIKLRLDYLENFIASLKFSKNGIIYIVDNNGQVIAFPKIPQAHHKKLMTVQELTAFPWITKSFEEFIKTGRQKFSFQFLGEEYLATYTPLSFLTSNSWWIGVIVPQSDFTNELQRTNLIILVINLLILFLGLVLVSSLVSRVVKPLKSLTKEVERIKSFDLEGDSRIVSRIKEIRYISDAIHAMKQGLRSFKRYVPALLVRQLIETGENAELNGTKKSLAIFFSDIQDFTSIAEQMGPELLIPYMSEYFDKLSRIIVHNKGSIDKYMGDAIMAFWGAPIPEQKPCHRAAKAALACIRCVNEFNAKQVPKGYPALITRIGIHFGEVIVGNFGSSERLNYTAIGDVVNTANRLEGINKVYGTHIIVSETIYQIIHAQFILRKLDCISVKGKTKAGFIYELIGENEEIIPYDTNAYRVAFEKGFSAYQKADWTNAILNFNECVNIYPTDSVAPLFIRRCTQFKEDGPPADWNGVWHFSEK